VFQLCFDCILAFNAAIDQEVIHCLIELHPRTIADALDFENLGKLALESYKAGHNC
jgi:hypothetical protein